MEQFVLLLVIAAISLVNWLIERSSKLREQRRLQKESADQSEPAPTAQSPIPESSAREELEEHMRRMMETFGFPTEEPRPLVEKSAPVVVFEEQAAPPPIPRSKQQPTTARPTLRRSKAATTAMRPRSPWVARLNSQQGLREAIVLREILGPPKAFSET
jgi:hypothetical protein